MTTERLLELLRSLDEIEPPAGWRERLFRRRAEEAAARGGQNPSPLPAELPRVVDGDEAEQ